MFTYILRALAYSFFKKTSIDTIITQCLNKSIYRQIDWTITCKFCHYFLLMTTEIIVGDLDIDFLTAIGVKSYQYPGYDI